MEDKKYEEIKDDLEKQVKLSYQQALLYAKELNDLYKQEKRKSKHLEKTLIQLKESQEELIQSTKLASVGQLAAGIAHEINSPLTAIMGYAEMCLLSAKDNEKSKKYLKIIVSECDRIGNTVRELLNFSRKGTENFQDIDVNEVIKSTLIITEHTLSRFKKVEVKTNYSAEKLIISGSKNLLQQVFMNLMLNAAQSMSEGGTLTITTYKKEGNIPQSIVEFQDTGTGIAEENLEKIFEPFFTTKKVGSGTGLGLSICKGIVEKHQGGITVESEQNKGTTFKIKIPLIK